MMYCTDLAKAFQRIAAVHGERTALLYPASRLQVSYSELAQLSEQLAVALRARGLRRGDVLAIFHDKSPRAFAAMLACLRLGVIYTNLDPDSPWPRLQRILSTCSPKLIVSAFAGLPFEAELLAAGCAPLLRLDALITPDMGAGPVEERTVPSGSPAYIMFTSGSTGSPKGAVMSHANVLWFASWARQRFAITPGDVLTNVNPMYFDNSVFDFYAALLSGATLVPLDAAQVRDPRGLVRLINQAACTVWFSVPSLLVYLLTTRALSEDDFQSMRCLAFGGEGFPKPKLRQLFELFGGRAKLENVYGPTECTCICSSYTVGADDFADMHSLAPLGVLADSFDYEILPGEGGDAQVGELLLRGPQVGLGYYADPQRTAQSFVQHPGHQRHFDLGYRTGDLVRRDEQGRLHFKGRADFQIKHMGYRIELEEIESALGTVADVQECAAIYLPRDDGLGQIVAFAALNSSRAAEDVLGDLAAALPAYMRPRRLHLLPLLPKNANGKIDRMALTGFATPPPTSTS
nr:amino acid adenylation domain-containing protein [uncultured Roseateles sp.]